MTSQALILKQAIFGEMQGAHAVRASTYKSRSLTALAMRLDLPDQTPVGVNWEPYLAGFPFEGSYVLAHVRLDPDASRSGMIACRAVIIANNDLGFINDLSQIAGIVKTVPPPSPLTDIEVIPSLLLSEGAGTLTIGLANILATRSKVPAVLPQGNEAENAVFQVWRYLPSSVRANFGFRLSFAPKDIVDTPPPALVFVPEQLKSRWPADRLVGHETTYSSALAEVLGGATSAERLARLASELGAEPTSMTDLARLDLAEKQLSGHAFEDMLAGYRLVQAMPFKANADLTRRSKIVSRLSELLADEPIDSAMLLRNVTAAGFGFIDPVWTALEHRIAQVKFERVDDDAIFELLAAARKSAVAEPDWKRSVIAGTAAAVKSSPQRFSEVLWRYKGIPEAFDIIDEIEGSDWDINSLIHAAPVHPIIQTAKAMEWLGRRQSLPELVAIAMRAQYPVSEALEKYSAFDLKLSSTKALDRILAGASAAEIVGAVTQRPELNIVSAAARALAGEPARFKNIDFGSAIVRQLWGAALAISTAAWSAPSDTVVEIERVLVSLTRGQVVDPELLNAISKSQHANLSAFAQRAVIWDAVSGSIRERFLKSTAAAWLQAISHGEILFDPDAQLQAEIMRAPQFLQSLGNTLKSGKVHEFLRAVSALSDLTEVQFRTLAEGLGTRDTRLEPAGATEFGKFVSSRHWPEAAAALKVAFEKGRTDLKPALVACQSLLPTWLRYTLGLGTPSSDESWELLRDVAVSLYPYGPDQEHLWQRSGGDNAQLSKGKGAAQWFDAIEMMRKGNTVKPDKLLREMKHDFPRNEQLPFLSNLTIFRSKGGNSLFSFWDPFAR